MSGQLCKSLTRTARVAAAATAATAATNQQLGALMAAAVSAAGSRGGGMGNRRISTRSSAKIVKVEVGPIDAFPFRRVCFDMMSNLSNRSRIAAALIIQSPSSTN